jgi:hypothetical protein
MSMRWTYYDVISSSRLHFPQDEVSRHLLLAETALIFKNKLADIHQVKEFDPWSILPSNMTCPGGRNTNVISCAHFR